MAVDAEGLATAAEDGADVEGLVVTVEDVEVDEEASVTVVVSVVVVVEVEVIVVVEVAVVEPLEEAPGLVVSPRLKAKRLRSNPASSPLAYFLVCRPLY